MKNKNNYKHKLVWKKRTLKKLSLHQYVNPERFDKKFAKELFEFYHSIYSSSCPCCVDSWKSLGIKKKEKSLKKEIKKELKEELLNYYNKEK